MDRIIVQPELVRGWGNVVSPKSLTDFVGVDSVVTSASETVDGVTTTVYTMEYNGFTFIVSVSQSYVFTGNTVTVSVTVLDADGEPVENASVDLYKEVE